MMDASLRFGIIGTGSIAGAIAPAIRETAGTRLTAVASRTREGAEAFAREHGAPRVFDSYRDLLAWEEVDAVYVATPTAVREEICVEAAQRGKHVLADKPFADLPSLRRIIAACRRAGVAFMDATHFTHHPRTHLLRSELVERIGRPHSIHTCFHFPNPDRTNIRYDPQKEPTGAIGDMAWYSMRAIVEYMPAADLLHTQTFVQRDEQTGAIVRGTGVLLFSNGMTSTWDAGYTCGAMVMDLSILGERGKIQMDDFILDWSQGFFAGKPGTPVEFVQRNGVMTPDQFAHVHAPSPRPQNRLMIANFAALAHNPSGQALEASIARSERTQALVDAICPQS